MDDIADFFIEPRSWHSKAACKDSGEDFFNLHRAARLKAICAECTVREQCLFESMYPKMEHAGIWGGLDPDERVRMARRQRDKLRREHQKAKRGG